MKIAHVVSTFPPRIGGMGQVCFKEAELLTAKGHEVTVFTLKYSQDVEESLPFKVIRLPALRLGDGGLAPQIFSKLAGFDLVHLHFPFYVSAHYVKKAVLKNNEKFVITYHMDAQPHSYFKRLIRSVYDGLYSGSIFKACDKVITIDKEYLKQSRLADLIKQDEAVEIFNGVDMEIFKEKKVENILPELENKKVILFVGNLMPIKNLDLLLQAVKSIEDENVVLLVVGGGYMKKKYIKLANDLGLKDRVIFVGKTFEKKDLADWYNMSDYTAIPSQTESFSLVALESLACACPVVANDIPGIRGRISHEVDGFLIKNHTAVEWAEILKKVLDLSDEQRQAMGKAGRAKVSREYSWEKHVDLLEKIYKQIYV